VRRTVSLDDDVANLIRQEMRRSGSSFKELVNRYIRKGFAALKQEVRKPFVVTPRAMGLPCGLSYDKVGELLDEVEGRHPLDRAPGRR
jgi:hypothetical protein